MTEIVYGMGDCAVVVDGTGVGEPVVEALLRADLGCEITAVTITSGEKQSRAGARCSVPKQDLIAGVQLPLEKRRLRVARRLIEAARALACWRAQPVGEPFRRRAAAWLLRRWRSGRGSTGSF